MNKLFFNLLLRIEKKQRILFQLITFFNEVYIKLYVLFVSPRMFLHDYRVTFSAKGVSFLMKRLKEENISELSYFLKNSINTESPDFFMPHRIDEKTLKMIVKRISHIPLGIYNGDELIGYGLIRLLFPDKGSYAIFIDEKWQGKGIGTEALREEIDIIKKIGFIPTSAVSKNNTRSLRMLKKLDIEFVNDLGDYFEVKDRGRP